MARLFGRILGTAAAGAVLSQGAAAEEGFDLLSAHLDGRDVLVFVDGQGMAVAVEMLEAQAEILTGLAAGALLSDIEAAARPGHTSREGATALIDGLGRLTETQRDALKTALAI